MKNKEEELKRIRELRRMIKEARAEQKASKSLIYENSIVEMKEELKARLEKLD